MRYFLLICVLSLFACGDETSNNANNTNNTNNQNNGNNENNGVANCQEQTEVTQTLFIGDTESLVLVDVPDGWEPERFTTMVGYLTAAPSADGNNRPEVGVNNAGVFSRDIADIATEDLESVATIMFNGEQVEIYLQRNQPDSGVNLEAYLPTTVGGDMMGQVTVLTSYLGSDAAKEACQDSLLDLAVLVSESLRENPDWVDQ